MGNIIKITSRDIFGLDKILHKPEKKEKKMIIPKKSVILRGKGLYAFVKKL
jgi:hypothetical protein